VCLCRGPAAHWNCDWGQGREKHAGSPAHQFSSTDAPPLPSPHIRGNRMQGSGGKNPRAVSAPLTEQVPNLRAESVRVPENRDDTSRGDGCPPTHTPPNEIGAGTHKTFQHDHPEFSSRAVPPGPSPAHPEQSCAGVRGCNPRAVSTPPIRATSTSSRREHTGSRKPGQTPPGGPAAPRHTPAGYDWGQEPTKPSSTTTQNFHREPYRPARPPHIQGNHARGSGGKNPRRGEGRDEGPGERMFRAFT